MILEHRVTVAAPRRQVWDFLMNIPEMAVCVPGVSGVKATGEDRYMGRLAVRVGPIGLGFDVQVTVEAADAETYTAGMQAAADDRRVGGAVRAQMRMTLTEMDGIVTEILIITDLNMMGRLGQFGQPVVRKKADGVLEEFTANLRTRLAAQNPAGAGYV